MTLMKMLLTIGDKNTNKVLKERTAARAVLLNQHGGVHLLHVSKHGYHKLPGGGVDEGETVEEALHRELKEEVGSSAEIIAELGIIEEFRSYDDGDLLHQISYCFLAKQVGELFESALEQGEIEEGLQHVIVNSIDEAIKLIKNDKPNNTEGEYIVERDLTFLNAAKSLLQQQN